MSWGDFLENKRLEAIWWILTSLFFFLLLLLFIFKELNFNYLYHIIFPIIIIILFIRVYIEKKTNSSNFYVLSLICFLIFLTTTILSLFSFQSKIWYLVICLIGEFILIMIPSYLVVKLFIDTKEKYQNKNKVTTRLLYTYILSLWGIPNFITILFLRNPLSISKTIMVLGLTIIFYIIFMEIPGYLCNMISRDRVLQAIENLEIKIEKIEEINYPDIELFEFKLIEYDLIEEYNEDVKNAETRSGKMLEAYKMLIHRVDVEKSFFINLNLHPLTWLTQLLSMTGIGVLIAFIIEAIV